ncbi:hypothetical protein CY652_02480 [Burkholderia sp. WAC0059]|uniref:hypothetical protein n=1 Tax=Burkholderia sp. WAC0059 TaxID=2066022 RepID=UPI000C7F4F8F|nr:hypothetical protein [Burkholderia sp. WAC0059]PLZ03862.1 hypothetical protein CY652_02480 [Burkholderia sp. WAC0059]
MISLYGRSVMTVNDDGAGSVAIAPTCPEESIFDERFLLKGGSGNELDNTYYTIRLPSAELRHGTTDSEGRTARYQTNGARNIAVHFGYKQTY